jgi:hypothetical protein
LNAIAIQSIVASIRATGSNEPTMDDNVVVSRGQDPFSRILHPVDDEIHWHMVKICEKSVQFPPLDCHCCIMRSKYNAYLVPQIVSSYEAQIETIIAII